MCGSLDENAKRKKFMQHNQVKSVFKEVKKCQLLICAAQFMQHNQVKSVFKEVKKCQLLNCQLLICKEKKTLQGCHVFPVLKQCPGVEKKTDLYTLFA